MLKNPSISTRVRLAVALPAAALVLVVLALFPIVQGFRIGGPAYNSVRQLQNLQVDATPSALLATRAVALANELYGVQFITTENGSDPAALKATLLQSYSEAKADFSKKRQQWTTSVGSDKVLVPLLTDVVSTAAKVLTEIDTNVLPKLTPSSATQARQSIAKVNELSRTHERAVAALKSALDSEIAKKESAAKSASTQRLIGLVGLSLLAMVGALLGSRGVMRSLLHPVEELTAQASHAAHHEIPALVAAVNSAGPGAEHARATPFPVGGDDEFSQLAVALNAMQDTAVNLAVDQARSRRGVSESLINLGRRNQGLLARTLAFITELEQNERNPDTLAHLFRLDHLTTRMRRNAESLLVLAGSEPPRVWSEPVALSDTIRASLSEIESYERVDLSSMDAARIKGTVVSDLAHLCAELMENATNFSPPSSRVVVLGRTAAEGYVLSIRDNGIGMTPDEIDEANARLADTGTTDATPSKVLGHYVVSKLAARHGIVVELSPTIGSSGITAEIFLPRTIVETQHSAEPARGNEFPATAAPTRGQPQAASQPPRGPAPQASSTMAGQVYDQSSPYLDPQAGYQQGQPGQPQYSGQPQGHGQPQGQPQGQPPGPPQYSGQPQGQPPGPPQYSGQPQGHGQPQTGVPAGSYAPVAQSPVLPPAGLPLMPEPQHGKEGLRRRVRGAQVPQRDVEVDQQQRAFEDRQAEIRDAAVRDQAVARAPQSVAISVEGSAPVVAAPMPPMPARIDTRDRPYSEDGFPATQPAAKPGAPTFASPAAPPTMVPPPPPSAPAALPTRNRGANWTDETAPAGLQQEYRDPQQVRASLSAFQSMPFTPPDDAGWPSAEAPVAAYASVAVGAEGSTSAAIPEPSFGNGAVLPVRAPGTTWAEPAGQPVGMFPTPSDPDAVRSSLSSFQHPAPPAAYAQVPPSHAKDQ